MSRNAVAWLFEVYEILKDHAARQRGDEARRLEPGRWAAAGPPLRVGNVPGALPEALVE